MTWISLPWSVYLNETDLGEVCVNIRYCIACPERAVVMVWVQKLGVDVPLCDQCRAFLVEQLGRM